MVQIYYSIFKECKERKQNVSSHNLLLIFSSYLCLGLPIGFFPSGLSTILVVTVTELDNGWDRHIKLATRVPKN
jgi:hypothetical protein